MFLICFRYTGVGVSDLFQLYRSSAVGVFMQQSNIFDNANKIHRNVFPQRFVMQAV